MSVELTAVQARRLRWRAQLLGGSEFSPAEVVQRAVALQGQELRSVVWAIAMRSRAGTTVKQVRAAFDAGELVRAWPMRGTLFAITPRRLAALLQVTAQRVQRSAGRRRDQLGLHDRVIAQAGEVLCAALLEGPRRRAEVMALWQAAGIDTSGGRGYHLLWHLCMDGLVWWGPFHESRFEQMIALAALPPVPDPDAALSDVVRGYVEARGPVTEADLAWWTKLPKTLLRRAASGVEDLIEVRVDGRPAWIVGEPADSGDSGGTGASSASSHAWLSELRDTGVTLVPGFDEWVLGYADRSWIASPAVLAALVPGGNGIFRPAVLVDGVAVGTWRMPALGSAAKPAITLVEQVDGRVRRAIDHAVGAWESG